MKTVVERRRRPAEEGSVPTKLAASGHQINLLENIEEADVTKAAVVLAWTARSMLSDLEREIESRSKQPDTVSRNELLRGLGGLFNGLSAVLAHMGYRVEAASCNMAGAAALSAYQNGLIKIGAERRIAPTDATKVLAERLYQKSLVIWGKSTEMAREEAHRALSVLAERFREGS